MLKKRKPPPIPGCSDSTVVVATHQSHCTATNAAALGLAQESGGKKETCVSGEMWPLELLGMLKNTGAGGVGGGGGNATGSGGPPSSSRSRKKSRSGSVAGTPKAAAAAASAAATAAAAAAAAAVVVDKKEVVACVAQQTSEQLQLTQNAQLSVLMASKEEAEKSCKNDEQRNILALQWKNHAPPEPTAEQLAADQAKYEAEKRDYDKKQQEYVEQKRRWDEYQAQQLVLQQLAAAAKQGSTG